MNLTLITGTIVTPPRFGVYGCVARMTFDVSIQNAGRSHTIHVQATNAIARRTRRLELGDQVTVLGYLQSEPFDMPDHSVWHPVVLVAYEIDDHAIPAVARLLEVEP